MGLDWHNREDAREALEEGEVEAEYWSKSFLSAFSEIKRLALWILDNTDRPNKNESAVDVAIDLMKKRSDAIELINKYRLAGVTHPILGEIMKALGA